MNLYKIQSELIAGRSADAWFRIMIAGPSFHYRWNWGTPDFHGIMGEHSEQAVCRVEPSLTLSWGMEVHSRANKDELVFDWALDFTDTTVRPFWADFFWNNALIDRVELARIDGGHGLIPL